MARIFFLLLFIRVAAFGQDEKKYTPDELKADIRFLKQKLEANHPNLYLYTGKKTIDSIFDSLANSINEPISGLEFYKHITIISSVIKDGHTIILPGSHITAFHNESSSFLPFKLRVINNRLFVEMVLTGDNTIAEGAEIMKLNAVDAKTIIQQLTQRQVRDGYNETYPLWIIDNYFREYYSYIFGHPSRFLIDYEINNTVQSATIAALPKDSINYFRQLKYPNKTGIKKPNEGITFTENPGNNVAFLTIKDFHKDVLKKEYRQNFKTEIKHAFELLNKSKIQNLVLDLRNNQGGEIEYGVYLLSFLLQEDFSVVDQYYKLSAGSEYQLSKTNGEESGIHKPGDVNFKGQLYVLINGGSFSNSGIVSTALRQHNRAIFVGNETGGNNKVLAGYTEDFTLPNTKTYVEIPTRQFMLSEALSLTGHGTMPDYEINETIDDVLAGRDIQKEFVLKLISEKPSGR